MTVTGWTIYQALGLKDGFYLYDNGAVDKRYGQNGNSTIKPPRPAVLIDVPFGERGSVKFEFQIFVIAKNGNGGKVLTGLSWAFVVDRFGRVTNTPPELVTNYQDFKDATQKWNEQAAGPAGKKNAKDQVPFDPFTFP